MEIRDGHARDAAAAARSTRSSPTRAEHLAAVPMRALVVSPIVAHRCSHAGIAPCGPRPACCCARAAAVAGGRLADDVLRDGRSSARSPSSSRARIGVFELWLGCTRSSRATWSRSSCCPPGSAAPPHVLPFRFMLGVPGRDCWSGLLDPAQALGRSALQWAYVGGCFAAALASGARACAASRLTEDDG